MPLLPPSAPEPSIQRYGYSRWDPHQRRRRDTPNTPSRYERLQQIGEIIDLDIDHLPLTIRQIYYRLVAQYDYPKTIAGYDNLVSQLTKARRARWYVANDQLNYGRRLLFDCIRDDKASAVEPDFYHGVNDFFDSVRCSAELLRLDRQKDQPRRLALWCEANGMVPQMQNIAAPFGIAVYSCGGFDSITEKRRIPMDIWSEYYQPITLLHFGNLDPSGIHMFESLARNLIAYDEEEAAGDIEACRIAILPEQTAGLPSAPPKATDNRGFSEMLVSVSTDDEAGEYIAINPRETWQLESSPTRWLSAHYTASHRSAPRPRGL
jgi:hypothetical protein